MLSAIRFSDTMPGGRQDTAKAREIMSLVQPHMEMRDAASLELQDPQIPNFGKVTAEIDKPGIEMILDRATVRNGVMIG
jgi:hypothetical protein